MGYYREGPDLSPHPRTFVVAFLWQMTVGFSAGVIEEPDSHLGCIHLVVEKPTNRLVIDVIASSGMTFSASPHIQGRAQSYLDAAPPLVSL